MTRTKSSNSSAERRRKAVSVHFDDVTVISDDDLRRFIGNIDENLFKTFFGIGHSMLVRGGQEIVEGQGDVGKILFSGSGVSELHKVLKDLDSELQALFLPSGRAKKPRLNDLLSKLEAARKTIRDSQLPHRQWDEHHRALERDLSRKKKAEEEFQQCNREHNRLQRVQEALPLIANRADLLKRRADLAAVPTLGTDFRERRQEIEHRLRQAEDQRTRASSALKSLDEQIQALDISEPFLEEREAIDPISRRLGVYQQAEDDRPGLDADLRRLEVDALQTLRKIDQSLELSDSTSVQIPDTQRSRIRNLGSQYDAVAKELDHWTVRRSNLQTEADQARKRLDTLPDDPISTPLRTALQQAMKLGDIEEQLAGIRFEHQTAKEQLDIDLQQLPLWSATPAELETLSVPPTETIERFETDLGAIDQQLRELRRDTQDCHDKSEDLESKIRRLRLEQDVPTEDELSNARARRRDGWALIRRAWHDGETADDEIRAFLESPGTGYEDLATGFERSIERADDLADRLRREAGRVTTLAELQAQREACEERITRLSDQFAQTKAERQGLLKEWTTLWEPAGVDPLFPGEMLAWTRQRSELAQLAKNVRRLHNDLQRLENRRNEQRDQLRIRNRGRLRRASRFRRLAGRVNQRSRTAPQFDLRDVRFAQTACTRSGAA